MKFFLKTFSQLIIELRFLCVLFILQALQGHLQRIYDTYNRLPIMVKKGNPEGIIREIIHQLGAAGEEKRKIRNFVRSLFPPEKVSMLALQHYFPVVLFIMLYKVVLTFESVDEILKCDHSNASY